MTRLTINRYAGPGVVDLSALFALVPDEIVLAVAGRDLKLFEYNQCLVGWTLREHLAALKGVLAEDIDLGYTNVSLQTSEELGGEMEDWRAVFLRVQFPDDVPTIEAAWVNRVVQAAENVDKPKIVLPADIFDTLELSAYAFGGIGAGTYNDGEDDATDFVGEEGELLNFRRGYDVEFQGADAPAPKLIAPVCAVGHAAFAAIPRSFDWFSMIDGNTITANDDAVEAINARKGVELSTKVTFEEWARELNVVRGDS
jgi:hypothetical protein